MGVIVDLSQWNVIQNWEEVRDSTEAVILRCGYTYSVPKDLHICVDQSYPEFRKAVERLKIPFSLYYVTSAITESEAEREAAYVISECRDIKDFVLPVFVDTEKITGQGRADNLSVDQRTRCVRAFCAALQRAGIPAGIYANENWFKERLDLFRLPFSRWVANWGDSMPGIEYLLWQFTNSATIPGISGRVDASMRRVDDPIQAVTDLALSEVGYLEKETDADLYDKKANAGDRNFQKYGYELHQIQPQNMDYPAPWCAAFVCWLYVSLFGLNQAKQMLCGNIDDYCPVLANQFKAAGRWGDTPKVGDLIFFGTPGSENHVGFVYQISAGHVRTIEGNTSSGLGVNPNGNGVWSKSYVLGHSKISGYGHPLY